MNNKFVKLSVIKNGEEVSHILINIDLIIAINIDIATKVPTKDDAWYYVYIRTSDGQTVRGGMDSELYNQLADSLDYNIGYKEYR